MIKFLFTSAVAGILAGTLVNGAIAGHNYHGYGMKMTEMSEIDSNEDGVVSFEEFSAPTIDKLKSGFKILDTNGDEKISSEEHDEFLRVHGFEKRPDS